MSKYASSPDKTIPNPVYPPTWKRSKYLPNYSIPEKTDSRLVSPRSYKRPESARPQKMNPFVPIKVIPTTDKINSISQRPLDTIDSLEKQDHPPTKRKPKAFPCIPFCCCFFIPPCLISTLAGILVLFFLTQAKTTTTTTTPTTTITTTTATITTTTITTTTTHVPCTSSCINTITSTSSRLAFYSFDNNLANGESGYPLSGISSPNYVNGWVATAIRFQYSDNQYLSTYHMPIELSPFTIEFWFYATDISSTWDFSFGGQNESQTTNKCLFMNIRNQHLSFGFFNGDTSGNTLITINQWYHAAFVYDNSSRQQTIYLNGLLDGSVTNTPLDTTIGNFTIGGGDIGGNTSPKVFYTGYIDHYTISNRAKSACEIYLDAVLACHFAFESSSVIDDSGPNFLTASNNGAVSTTGQVNQALNFTSSLSFIMINGIQALTSINSAFTISMWINPTSVSGGGTLIHSSTQTNGQGTCLAMWGLTTSGEIVVNVMDASNNVISTSGSSILPTNQWIHIAQTFGPTNGNSLYINGVLISSVATTVGRSVGPYIFIGASPSGTGSCGSGSNVMGQFLGGVDEFRVYGRELSSTDICNLSHP